MVRIIVYGTLGGVLGFMTGLLTGIALYEIKWFAIPPFVALIGLGSGAYLGIRRGRYINKAWAHRPFATPGEVAFLASAPSKFYLQTLASFFFAIFFASIASYILLDFRWDDAFEFAYTNFIISAIFGFVISFVLGKITDQLAQKYGKGDWIIWYLFGD